MRGKEEKKGRGKERGEKEKKGGKIEDQIAKERSPCAFFSSAQSSFLDQSEVRYLEKRTLYLLLFSCTIFSINKLCDF